MMPGLVPLITALQARAAEVRVGFFYFVLFTSAGIATPFVPLWLAHEGLSSGQIGIILSAPQYLMLLMSITVGRLADRASDWRAAIIVCCALSLLPLAALFFTHHFWPILLFWTLTFACSASISPVLDAASVRLTRRRGSEFAVLRACGSIAFVICAFAGGYYFDALGIGTFLATLTALAILRLLAAFSLPRFRQDQPRAAPPPVMAVRRPFWQGRFEITNMLGTGACLSRNQFLLTILAIACLNASHAFLTVLGPIHWQAQGLGGSAVGLFWSVSVAVEVGIMFTFRRVFARIDTFAMLIFAGVVAALRWSLMALDGGFWVSLFCQSLHGFTFALVYLGTANFLANWTHDHNAAEASSFAAVLTAGLFATTGLVSGLFYDQLGRGAFWIVAVLAGVATLQILWVKHAIDSKKVVAA